jgi:hypothetical protein
VEWQRDGVRKGLIGDNETDEQEIYHMTDINKANTGTNESHKGELRSLYWNIEGLKGFMKNHSDLSLFQEYDVVCFVETFIASYDANILGTDFKIFQRLANPTRGRPSGGIIIASKKQYKAEFIVSTDHTLVVDINGITIIGAYFQPKMEVPDICTELLELITSDKMKNRNPILMGDFNCRMDYGERGVDLVEALEEMEMVHIDSGDEKTYFGHNGSSKIDLIFSHAEKMENIRAIHTNRHIERKHVAMELKLEYDMTIIREKKR